MNKKCFIFGAGDYGKMKLSASDTDGGFVIAADGGHEYLIRFGIVPDLVIGDFDSLSYVPENENTVVLPKEKDDTDMLAAIKAGIGKGFREFYLFGGLGGRLDHTIANIQSLEYITEQGGRGCLVSDDTVLTVIGGERLSFKAGFSGVISVFSLGDRCSGVTLRGLKYELDGAEVRCGFPVGVSNEFTGAASSVSIDSGKLIVMWENNRENLSLGLMPDRKAGN